MRARKDVAKNEDPPPFKSLTQEFLSSRASQHMFCPRCGDSIDFSAGVEWRGPHHFICHRCDRLIGMDLILRAMKDLGAEKELGRR